MQPLSPLFWRVTVPVSTLLDADRPRERLWSLGPAALTTAELLAIVLGTGGGGQDVLELAARLLEVSEGSLPPSSWVPGPRGKSARRCSGSGNLPM